jgi:hypothetical protein
MGSADESWNQNSRLRRQDNLIDGGTHIESQGSNDEQCMLPSY